MPLRSHLIGLALGLAILVLCLGGCGEPATADGTTAGSVVTKAAPAVPGTVVFDREQDWGGADSFAPSTPVRDAAATSEGTASADQQVSAVSDPTQIAAERPTQTLTPTVAVRPTDSATPMPVVPADSTAPPSAQPVTVVPRPTAVSVVVGSVAPDLSLVDLEGAPQRLADRTGKIVLLNFWASWCGHCRSEIPHLNTIYDEYKDQGLEIVAVSVGEDPAELAAFIQQNDVRFPVLVDPQGAAIITYRLRAIPTSYFLNDQGVVQLIYDGAFTEESLREIVGDLLGTQGG